MTRKLPEWQEKVLTLLEEGKSFDEVNEILEIQHARQYYRAAMNAISKEDLLKRFPRVAMSQDEHDDQMLSQELVQSAKLVGLPEKIVKEVQKRLAARSGKVSRNGKRLTEKEAIGRLEERLYLALDYLDDFALSAASAKDLSGTIDTLINNIQLLKGKPTSIMSIEDRRKLNELIPALLIEAQRRGVPLPPPPIEVKAIKVE